MGSDNLLSVEVYAGKYTVVQEADGNVKALRYGKEWRDCCGDGLVLALAQEVEQLRDFAIWMTGCGYDFCQHEHFTKQRGRLLK